MTAIDPCHLIVTQRSHTVCRLGLWLPCLGKAWLPALRLVCTLPLYYFEPGGSVLLNFGSLGEVFDFLVMMVVGF